MKRKSRAAVLTALTGVAALALSGCTQGGASDQTLSVMVWDNGPASITAYQELVAGFEAAHDGVKVNLETVNTSDYGNLVKTRLSGGKGPDVYGVQPSLTPDLIAGGYLTDVSGQDWFAKLNDGAKNAPNAVKDGKTYSFPISQAADGIVYNVDLFAQAGIASVPTTYAELVTAAEALKEQGVTPFAMSAGDNWWPQFILYHLTAQNVVYPDPESGADIMAGTRTFGESEGWRRTIEQYAELVPFYASDPVGTTQAAVQAAFLQGEAAMFPAAWILPEVRSTDLEVGYFNFPATDDPNVPAIWGGYPVQLGINPGNGKTELAQQFADYLFSDGVYADFLEAFGSYPVIDGVELEGGDPLSPTLMAAWEGKSFEPSPPDTWLPGVQDAMLASIQELTAGRIGVDDVLSSMDEAVAAARG